MEMECVLDSRGSSHGNPIARPVASQVIRNDISHEEAMLVACCLHFLRASNGFYTFCETAEQEQQVALFSLQVPFQLSMLFSIVHMAL